MDRRRRDCGDWDPESELSECPEGGPQELRRLSDCLNMHKYCCCCCTIVIRVLASRLRCLITIQVIRWGPNFMLLFLSESIIIRGQQLRVSIIQTSTSQFKPQPPPSVFFLTIIFCSFTPLYSLWIQLFQAYSSQEGRGGAHSEWVRCVRVCEGDRKRKRT